MIDRLNDDEVKAFVLGRALDCFDALTEVLSARIEYHTDGTCHAAMSDGTTDDGRYGFEGDLYWTQYRWFRAGGLYRFYLVRIDDVTCQAYFEDGKTAFLQRIGKAAV